MTIQIENEYSEIINIDYEAIAERVIEGVLDYEECPYEAEVNIVLTNAEEIRIANREFRGIDKETDVLSFPMVPFSFPADYDIIEEMDDCFNPDSGELMLGDIMISIPRMMEQAEAYGHSEVREYAFLIAHSMLHLLGYDHMAEEEAKVMEAKQRDILDKLNIKR